MLKSEFESLVLELDTYLANNVGYKRILFYKYGLTNCVDVRAKLKELLLYKHIFKYWKQYGDGTPVPDVNFITIEEFNQVANRTKFLIRT